MENIFETDTAEGKGHNEAIDEKALCKKIKKENYAQYEYGTVLVMY